MNPKESNGVYRDFRHVRTVDELIVHGVQALRQKSKLTQADAVPSRKPRMNLADLLSESTFAGSEIGLERQQDYGRPVDFVSGFLLDTNVLSEFKRRGEPDPHVRGWLRATDPDLLWTSVLSFGEIRKGIERLAAGKEPACTYVCPPKAVIFGRRDVLLREAHRRIDNHPGKYFEKRVYGEKEAGGTQVLYLAAVNFDLLGLPHLSPTEHPSNWLRWQERVMKYFLLPVSIYGVMVAFLKQNFREHEAEIDEEH